MTFVVLRTILCRCFSGFSFKQDCNFHTRSLETRDGGLARVLGWVGRTDDSGTRGGREGGRPYVLREPGRCPRKGRVVPRTLPYPATGVFSRDKRPRKKNNGTGIGSLDSQLLKLPDCVVTGMSFRTFWS